MAKDTKVRCSFKLSLAELNARVRLDNFKYTAEEFFQLASTRQANIFLRLDDGSIVEAIVNLSYISIE